jgi:hypothetical protein
VGWRAAGADGADGITHLVKVDELAVWARPDDQQLRAQPEGWSHTLSASLRGRQPSESWGGTRGLGEGAGRRGRRHAQPDGSRHVTARVTVTVTVLDAARNVVLSRPEPDILKRKEKTFIPFY